MSIKLTSLFLRLLLIAFYSQHVLSFPCTVSWTRKSRTLGHSISRSSSNGNDIECSSKLLSEEIPNELQEKIQSVASSLWGGQNHIPINKIVSNSNINQYQIYEGEASYSKDDDGGRRQMSQRAEYFHQEALNGCPKAQHSYALILWSGYGDTEVNPEKSARFHAAAAFQNHLDGIAVLGGCLRTGSGIKKDVQLGLKLIEYCAEQGNPTGINKKAALLESNQDYTSAFRLYRKGYETGRVNALLLFNLGWCYSNGLGIVKKNTSKGIVMWKKAVEMLPDEGSEEAAWYLYEHFKRDDMSEAKMWLDIAIDLGYHDAIEERKILNAMDEW